MIKKEDYERKKSKFKQIDSYRKRSRSSSSSPNSSYFKRKSSKYEKANPVEQRPNFDMNFLKLQYDNYLKNAAAILSQNMGSINKIQNMHPNILPNMNHAINPLLNNFYPSPLANLNQHNKMEGNSSQNNYLNFNLMPHMLPILNPFMPLIPLNPQFTQPFYPVGFDFCDAQKNQMEKININNFNFIKNCSSDSKEKKNPKESSSCSSSQSNSHESSKKGKYFDLKHLSDYKELETKMKRDQPEINLNDSKLMDKELLMEKPEEILNISSSSSDKIDEFLIVNNVEENAEVKENLKIEENSLKNSSSRLISSSSSNSSSSYSSISSEERLSSHSRRENRKPFGYKRKRSISSRQSYDRHHSMSSSLSKEKYISQHRNQIRRPYNPYSYRNHYRNDKYSKYVDVIMNQNDYKEYKRNKHINKNNYNKYGNYSSQYHKKIKYSDGYFRNRHEYSPSYSRDRFKSFTREEYKNNRNESPRNFAKQNSKEVKEEIEKEKFEGKDSENILLPEINKDLNYFSGDTKRDFYKKRVSNFSENPNESTTIKSEIIKETKNKISKFTDTPIITSKGVVDQNKEEPDNSFQSYLKYKSYNVNNNLCINYNKNSHNNIIYRYESLYPENSLQKIVPDLEDRTIKEINKEVKTSILINSSDQKPRENEKKIINEEIIAKEENKDYKMINPINSPKNSTAALITTMINPSKINPICEKIDLINNIAEKNITNTNKIITKNNETLISTTSKEKPNNLQTTIETLSIINKNTELGNKKNQTLNIINNNNLTSNPINPPGTNLSTIKLNPNTNIEKTNISTIINQSTQRIILNYPSLIKLTTPKVEDTEIPKQKLWTDLSSMLQKDNNFKIINVLGKKKIILNKERKNPDIKLKK